MIPLAATTMSALTRIYYFPIDAQGNESEEPVPVDLNPDGSANLTQLPHELRKSLEGFGAPNSLGTGMVSAKEGSAFLRALVSRVDPYTRFRIDQSKL